MDGGSGIRFPANSRSYAKPLSMKALLFALSFFLLAFRSPAQVQGLKEQALESFRRERYDEAVALMERAAEADPADAELVLLRSKTRPKSAEIVVVLVGFKSRLVRTL